MKNTSMHTYSLELSPKSLDFEATSIYYVSKIPRAPSIFVYRSKEHACSYPLSALHWRQREVRPINAAIYRALLQSKGLALCEIKTLRFCIINCLEAKHSPPQLLFAAVPNRVIVYGREQRE